jgi:hypothetical protein
LFFFLKAVYGDKVRKKEGYRIIYLVWLKIKSTPFKECFLFIFYFLALALRGNLIWAWAAARRATGTL